MTAGPAERRSNAGTTIPESNGSVHRAADRPPCPRCLPRSPIARCCARDASDPLVHRTIGRPPVRTRPGMSVSELSTANRFGQGPGRTPTASPEIRSRTFLETRSTRPRRIRDVLPFDIPVSVESNRGAGRIGCPNTAADIGTEHRSGAESGNRFSSAGHHQYSRPEPAGQTRRRSTTDREINVQTCRSSGRTRGGEAFGTCCSEPRNGCGSRPTPDVGPDPRPRSPRAGYPDTDRLTPPRVPA